MAEHRPHLSDTCLIIAARDEEKTIEACINSALLAAKGEAEIMVIDDGSVDSTPKILEGFGEKIRVIREGGKGPAYGRNRAVQETQKEWIAFADADCVLHEDCLEELCHAMDGRPTSISSAGGLQVIPSSAGSEEREIGEFLEAVGFVSDYVHQGEENEIREVAHNPTCNVLYSREALEKANGFDETLWPCEDLDLDLRLAELGYKALLQPKAVVEHHRPVNRAAFYRWMKRYGAAHALLVRKHGLCQFLHFLPLFFPVGFIFVFALALASPFVALLLAGVGVGIVFFLFFLRVSSLRKAAMFTGLLFRSTLSWLHGFYGSLASKPGPEAEENLILSIVVPAYNEESHIEAVVDTLVSLKEKIANESGLANVEVIVVNDGSTDQTGPKLTRLLEKHGKNFRTVTHPQNRGYGAALKSGFADARGEFLSFMDADGTISPESFIRMYHALKENEADMVVGTRFGEKDSGMPMIRKVGNLFFATLLSFLSGEKVKDSASGMRLFRRRIVNQLLPLPDGLHFTPAMSTKAIHEKLKITEIPIPYEERQGESKLNVISDGLRFLRIIVGTVLMYNPFKVFLLVGLLFEIMAALLVSAPIYTWATQTQFLFSDYIYRSIGALYFFTVGVQIILFGILARFMVSTFFKRHETGHFIHRMNRHLRVYENMSWYGMAVLFFGVVINGLYFLRFLAAGGIEVHWGWLLFAAGLIIVGFQMIITGVVMRILTDIKAARE